MRDGGTKCAERFDKRIPQLPMGAAPLRHGRSRPNWVAGAALTLAAPRAIVIESRASGGAAVASALLDQRHVSEATRSDECRRATAEGTD